jgi:hypothetical protein
MAERWTHRDPAEELRLAATALRQALKAARHALEVTGLYDLLPPGAEASVADLADWLEDRAQQFEDEGSGG